MPLCHVGKAPQWHFCSVGDDACAFPSLLTNFAARRRSPTPRPEIISLFRSMRAIFGSILPKRWFLLVSAQKRVQPVEAMCGRSIRPGKRGALQFYIKEWRKRMTYDVSRRSLLALCFCREPKLVPVKYQYFILALAAGDWSRYRANGRAELLL